MSAAICASWARYHEGLDEHGEPIEIVDRLQEELARAAEVQQERPTAFIENRELFGDLVDEPRFRDPYISTLEALCRGGLDEASASSRTTDSCRSASAPKRRSSAALALNSCAAYAPADDVAVAAATSPATWIARRGADDPSHRQCPGGSGRRDHAQCRGDVGVAPFVERTGVVWSGCN